MVLLALTCLLLPLVSPAPSEGCGRPLDPLLPGRNHRLTVSVSEPGRPDIQRWAVSLYCYIISSPIMTQGLRSPPTRLL